MDRAHRSPALRLTALVAGQALVVAALVLAAARPPVAGAPVVRGMPRWFTTAPPLDAVVVVAHRMALLVATWLLAATLLHVVAALARVPALVRVTARATLPGVRRVVAAAVVTVGVVAPLATPGVAAHAAGTGGRASGVRDGRAAPARVVVSTAAPASPATSAGRTVVVQAGDSLWSIAEGVAAGEHVDVGERWLAICAANAGRLRSGDPAVVYAGEEIVIPS